MNNGAFETEEAARQLVDTVQRQTGIRRFDLAVVLGSGWNSAAGLGQTLGVFNYSDWPCFPVASIAGHAGQLIAARLASWNLLFFSGRFHCYQGVTAFQAAFPVRLADALGVPRLLLTCAAGGLNSDYQPGQFMLVDDHINLLGENPLRGLPGNIFVDLSDLYAVDLYNLLIASGPDDLVLHRGILAALPGPSYETPAEIRMLQNAGADVVSMSIVPEAIMARFAGLQVAAVAFVTNHAAGLSSDDLSHQDVLDCSGRHAEQFPRLIERFVSVWQTMTL